MIEQLKAQTYVLRIYQRSEDKIVGVLKDVATNRESSFTHIDELWNILSQEEKL
jgi:hypothetical protein